MTSKRHFAQGTPTVTENPNLGDNYTDKIVATYKAVAGAVPVVGSFLSELGGSVIPNQRMDRLADFAKKLDAKLIGVEQDLLKAKLTDENFTDLAEETLHQTVRSTSDERREYLASLLANGMKQEKISAIESKHLLKILGQINDIEVVWLKAYFDWMWVGETEFTQKHEVILRPVGSYMGAPQELTDKESLQKSYKSHLAQLGLLRPRYTMDRNSMPEFDMDRGLKLSGYEITGLGQLLVRQIDLVPQ